MKIRLAMLVVIVLIWVVVACSLTDLLPHRQQASLTSTPTRTPKPTFTATSTPTRTLTPSVTPTPTHTPTPTPTPTNTPTPSNTPTPTKTPTITPIPTDTTTPTPSLTPTNTPRPTPRPRPRPTNTPIPKPTNTPPPPFTGSVVNGWPNCGTKGVMGTVIHGSGDPYSGVRVGVWTDAWDGRVSGPSAGDGAFSVSLNDLPAGAFKVAVVRPETCSTREGLPTARDCQKHSNVVSVTIFEVTECGQQGTVQWSEIQFIGP